MGAGVRRTFIWARTEIVTCTPTQTTSAFRRFFVFFFLQSQSCCATCLCKRKSTRVNHRADLHTRETAFTFDRSGLYQFCICGVENTLGIVTCCSSTCLHAVIRERICKPKQRATDTFLTTCLCTRKSTRVNHRADLQAEAESHRYLSCHLFMQA